jgi:hypothetical protein
VLSITPSGLGSVDEAVQDILLALQGAMTAVRRHQPDVPETVTLPAPLAPRAVLAYYADARWLVEGERVGEICVSADFFVRGGEHAMICLLHEAVHAAHASNGVKGTSRQGRYHNNLFARTAVEFGLVVARHGVIGYTTPALQPHAQVRYAPAIQDLDKALRRLHRISEAVALDDEDDDGPLVPGQPVSESSSGKYVSAVCLCVSSRGPRRLRMASAAWGLGAVRREGCGAQFRPERS